MEPEKLFCDLCGASGQVHFIQPITGGKGWFHSCLPCSFTESFVALKYMLSDSLLVDMFIPSPSLDNIVHVFENLDFNKDSAFELLNVDPTLSAEMFVFLKYWPGTNLGIFNGLFYLDAMTREALQALEELFLLETEK